MFQLGFFSPDKDSENGYLGIWYYDRPPGQSIVVWVANRNRSLHRAAAALNLTSTGNLILFDGETLVWSTGTSTESNSARLQLLDSGNLMLLTAENFSSWTLWQSFDHPSDTLLPGMKLGFDLRRNASWQLVSWRSDVDPSPGNFTHEVETRRSRGSRVHNEERKHQNPSKRTMDRPWIRRPSCDDEQRLGEELKHDVRVQRKRELLHD